MLWPVSIRTTEVTTEAAQPKRKVPYLFRLPSEREHACLYADCLELRPVEVIARPCQFLEIHIG